MAHIKRLKRVYVVPDFQTQVEFRRLIQKSNRIRLIDLANDLGIGLSVAQELFRHFRNCKQQNVTTLFCFWGEVERSQPALCAACGIETRRTTNNLCRSCFLGAAHISHYTATVHQALDRERCEGYEEQCTREAMQQVTADEAAANRAMQQAEEQKPKDLLGLSGEWFLLSDG